jgi:hypothetical protein
MRLGSTGGVGGSGKGAKKTLTEAQRLDYNAKLRDQIDMYAELKGLGINIGNDTKKADIHQMCETAGLSRVLSAKPRTTRGGNPWTKIELLELLRQKLSQNANNQK